MSASSDLGVPFDFDTLTDVVRSLDDDEVREQIVI